MSENINPFDLHRMFLGDLSLLFVLEVVFRTGVMYACALLVIRLMGKRGRGSMSAFDYVVIIALGSAAGDPMLYPSVPLLHGMAVLTTIVVLQRALILAVHGSDRAEAFVSGTPTRLVRDGVIDLEGIENASLAPEKLFMLLRPSGVRHLGQVRDMFMEQTGKVSIFRWEDGDSRPGLSIVPPWDIDPPMRIAGETEVDAGQYACMRCGHVTDAGAETRLGHCPNCNHTEWALSVGGDA